MNSNFFNEKVKNVLTAIFAGIFIIGLAFTYYKFTNDRFQPSINDGLNTIQDTTLENGDSANDSFDSTLGTGGEYMYAEWVATDYVMGDITTSPYTVKSGDTLWEIAEAKYGDGFQWTKILDANRDNIGFLPNGSQALITVGQTLVLP